MDIKINCFPAIVLLAILLAGCASGGPTDDMNFDYSKAKISDFDGYWEGRVDCRYTDGFMPLPWVRITDGRGEFGFGKGKAGVGYTLKTLHADFDAGNGKISWSGKLVPSSGLGESRVSFKGQWQDKKFKLKGSIKGQSCVGALNKI